MMLRTTMMALLRPCVACRCLLLVAFAAALVTNGAPPRSRTWAAGKALALDAKSHESSTRYRKSGEGRTLGPKPPGWFDAFSEEESTWDEGATETSPDFPLYKVLDGWGPDNGGSIKGIPAKVFHESPSAAWHQAWQTNYPSLKNGAGGPDNPVSAGTGSTHPWYVGAGGSWNQEYNPYHGGVMEGMKKPARWFDNSVANIDGYGRPKEPYVGAGERFWWAEEKAVNTTLTCADQGCVANTTLQLFDSTTEAAIRCRMNFKVHATDFDEEYSQETVEWIIVNDVYVMQNCMPGQNGCATQDAVPLYPCFEDMDITHLIPFSGTLQIAAKISDTVDECPYDGNLLSAVPVVSCLVTPQNPSPMYGGKVIGSEATDGGGASSEKYSSSNFSAGGGVSGNSGGWSYGDASGSYDMQGVQGTYNYQGPTLNGGANGGLPPGMVPGLSIGSATPDGQPYYPFGDLSQTVNSYYNAPGVDGNGSAAGDWGMGSADGQAAGTTLGAMVGNNLFRAISPLSCIDRGCRAFTMMKLNSTAVQFGQCFLSVFVNSTDFDNADSKEVILYIGTDTKNLTYNANPGKNPCKSAAQGKPLTQEEMTYTAIKKADITADCADGYLQVIGQISEYVDECASNGYLFNAIAQVDCQITGPVTTPEEVAGTKSIGLLETQGFLQKSAKVGAK